MLDPNRMKSLRDITAGESSIRNAHCQSQLSSSTGASLSELPSCLIPFILVKLPVKNIMICKCVCKSWNHLILEPYFTRLYAQKSPFTTMLLLRRHAFRDMERGRERYISCLEIQNNNGDDDVIRTPLNLEATLERIKDERSDIHLHFVGSCNGLLCLIVTPLPLRIIKRAGNPHVRKGICFNANSVILINNPLTGESVKIPQIIKKGNRSGAYGFCATVDGDCYKLVRIAAIYDFINGERRCSRLDSKVITIGVDDEWRDFQDPALRNFNSSGVALNGLLHWIDRTSDSIYIYAFDVEKEIGHCIPGPADDIQAGYPCLGVLDGQLCFTKVNEDENENELQIDLWTMRQYGVAGSWTKDIIRRTSIPSQRIYSAIPRTIRGNGEILLSLVMIGGREILISFDPKTKNYVNLEVVFAVDDRFPNLQEYAPCFSSLPGIISRQQITN